MRSFFLSIVIFSVALVFSGKSHALILPYETDKVKVEVVSQNTNINQTQNFAILIKFSIKNGWHILANPAGDVGKPTTVDIKLPNGYEPLTEKWSAHKRFEIEGIVQYGWDDVAYYEAEIKPIISNLKTIEIPINIEWQACSDECVLEKVQLVKSYDITHLNPLVLPLYQKFKAEMQDVEKNDYGLWWVLLFAFSGGLILNFMPCVFPILSLKIISLVRSSKDNKHLKIEALIYMTGVVLSFVFIAGIMVCLRLQGEAVGWGFQLQSIWFVTIVLAIFVIVLLMLLDILNVPAFFADRISKISEHKNKISTFVTGFFAVLIASPCTAPFMGIAIGYTLTQPVIIYFPIFAVMGIGYALPFTLAGFFPRFLYLMMPKSGKWMAIIKKIFAIPVFLTCIWLGWILLHQIGGSFEENSKLEWREYNSEEIQNLCDKGERLFINFTAKWCLTCLLNDKAVLSSEEFEKLVTDKNVYLFKVDWTNESDEVTQVLAKYGRNSIPLYVYYDGESNNAKILPQLLTISIIKEYVQ